MTKDEILSGIVDYEREQAILLRVVRREGGMLTESRFDQIFSMFKWTVQPNGHRHAKTKRTKLRFRPRPKAFILGSFVQGDLEWTRWLELTQLMVGAGILASDKNNKGEICYRLHDC